MKEPQEFHPIDDFYRKVLENPAQTSSNPGWDVPSSQVWENVQKGARPVGGLWLKALGVAAAVGLLAAAVYVFNRPQPTTTLPENPPAPAVHQPTTPALEPASNPGTTPKTSEPKASEPATKPAAKPTVKPAEPRVNHSQQGSDAPTPATYNHPGTPKSVEPSNAQPAPILPGKATPSTHETQKPSLKNTPPPRNHREENAKSGGQN